MNKIIDVSYNTIKLVFDVLTSKQSRLFQESRNKISLGCSMSLGMQKEPSPMNRGCSFSARILNELFRMDSWPPDLRDEPELFIYFSVKA